jgi:hypothetical protein
MRQYYSVGDAVCELFGCWRSSAFVFYRTIKKRAECVGAFLRFIELWNELVRRNWHNVHTATTAVKFHVAVHKSPDRVVTAEADIAAGLEFGSTLAENDIPGDDGLAAEFFNSETLADAVASVFDTALSFFMSHKKLLS